MPKRAFNVRKPECEKKCPLHRKDGRASARAGLKEEEGYLFAISARTYSRTACSQGLGLTPARSSNFLVESTE